MARYSQPKIKRLLQAADNAATTKGMGEKLEQLSRYLFEKISGVEFHDRNVLDIPGAHEIDLAFWSPQNVSLLCFLDAVLIVECKHHSEPIGSRDVNWFIQKLRARGLSSGVLVSVSGITGGRDGESCAHSEVLKAMEKDGTVVLVVTRAEILRLRDPEDLVALLKKKFLAMKVQRTVSLDSGDESAK